ncbi:hypothetical protein REPUB_Repub07fG0228800 [Reevesia pubescens]
MELREVVPRGGTGYSQTGAIASRMLQNMMQPTLGMTLVEQQNNKNDVPSNFCDSFLVDKKFDGNVKRQVKYADFNGLEDLNKVEHNALPSKMMCHQTFGTHFWLTRNLMAMLRDK